MKTIKMKTTNRIMTTILTLGMGLSLLSCGDKKSTEADQSEQTTQIAQEETIETKEASAPNEQAQAILSAYLKIKDALVGTDGEAASAAADELLAAMSTGNNEAVTKIKTDAEHISRNQDTDHQRDHFNTLSQNVYELVKTTSANEAPVYKQFCPMAFDNTGAFWLSSEEEIKNPYFGDMMLTCGAINETL